MKKSVVEGKTNNKLSIRLFDFSRHGETPSGEQIDRFINVCNEFSKTNPNDIIGMIKFLNFSYSKINLSLRCSLYTWI
jgi:hypothetical protein